MMILALFAKANSFKPVRVVWLQICRMLRALEAPNTIEAMGGTIVAVDTPGGGLTVRVTLPALMSGVRTPLGGEG